MYPQYSITSATFIDLNNYIITDDDDEESDGSIQCEVIELRTLLPWDIELVS